jgi:hypothetical protein
MFVMSEISAILPCEIQSFNFSAILPCEIQSFNFDLWKSDLWSFSHDNFFSNLKKRLQQPGARRTRAWHHHGSDTPTSSRAILHHTDAILCTFLHTTVDRDFLRFFGTVCLIE